MTEMIRYNYTDIDRFGEISVNCVMQTRGS